MYLSFDFLKVMAAWSSSLCSHSKFRVGIMIPWCDMEVNRPNNPTSARNWIYLLCASIFCCKWYTMIIDLPPWVSTCPSPNKGSIWGGGSSRMRLLRWDTAMSPSVFTPCANEASEKWLSHREIAPAYTRIHWSYKEQKKKKWQCMCLYKIILMSCGLQFQQLTISPSK